MTSFTSRFITANGIRIHYWREAPDAVEQSQRMRLALWDKERQNLAARHSPPD